MAAFGLGLSGRIYVWDTKVCQSFFQKLSVLWADSATMLGTTAFRGDIRTIEDEDEFDVQRQEVADSVEHCLLDRIGSRYFYAEISCVLTLVRVLRTATDCGDLLWGDIVKSPI